MIITYPTGYFISVLPHKPEDSGNITFLVSSQKPPRAKLEFSQLPAGIDRRLHSPRIYDAITRRRDVSILTASTSEGRASQAHSGVKQYEPGEILEFASGEAAVIQPMLVSKHTEIRHDTNLLDLSAMGLADDESNLITASANDVFQQLIDDLNDAKSNRATLETTLTGVQKQINELDKTLAALEVTITSTGDQRLVTIKSKLLQTHDELLAESESLVQQINDAATTATDLNNKLLTVSQLVR